MIAALLLAVNFGAGPLSPATFSGTVRNAKTGQGIGGAEVRFVATGELTVSDSAGVFRITVSSGERQTALVRRIGFAPMTVELEPGETGANTISLEPVATLDSVVVVDRSTAAALASFEEHRRSGFGHFWTRTMLANLSGRPLAEALAQTPGINNAQLFRGMHSYVASSRRSGRDGGACYSRVYLDQAIVYRGPPQRPFDLNSINAEQVEAIEFYASPAQVPAKYQGLDTDCGVLVIWTRRTPG